MDVIIIVIILRILMPTIYILHKKLRFFPFFFLLVQVFFLVICYNMVISSQQISQGKFLYFVLLICLLTFLRKFLKSKKKYFFGLSRIQKEINLTFNKIVYFNKHSYYFFNKYLVYIAKFVEVVFLKDHQRFFWLFYEFPQICILILAFFEIFFSSTLYGTFLLLLFVLFIQRLIFNCLKLSKKIAQNSNLYNFRQIKTSLNFHFVKKDSKDYLFIFLNPDNANAFIFKNPNFKKEAVLEKYFILLSILMATKNYLHLHILIEYDIPKYKNKLDFLLLISISFFCFIKNVFDLHFLISFCIIFDSVVVFLLFLFLFLQNYHKDSLLQVSKIFTRIMISIPIFFEDLKNFYITQGFVKSKEINKITPRKVFLALPKKPDFLEGFQELDVYNTVYTTIDYAKMFFSFFSLIVVIFLGVHLHITITDFQESFYQDLSKECLDLLDKIKNYFNKPK